MRRKKRVNPDVVALLNVFTSQQFYLHRRIDVIEQTGYAIGTDPERAVVAELNAAIAKFQDCKAAASALLRRLGHNVPTVPNANQIIEAEDRSIENHFHEENSL